MTWRGRSWSLVPAAGLLTAAVLAGGRASSADEFAFFVGEQVCRECHVAARGGRACAIEPVPAHARAFEALRGPEAEHIAALSGVVGTPLDSRICRGCHSTAADEGARWTRPGFDPARGVQCEACHGAGSRHVEHHGAAQADARAPDVAPDLRIDDHAADCKVCHLPRASHEEVLQRGYRRPVIDRSYRTPVALAISPDGRTLYAVASNADLLSVIDVGTQAVAAEIAVGRRPQDVAVAPDGGRLYVSNRFDDSVSVVDSTSRRVLHEIAVGDDPHGVLTDAAGRRLYVLNAGQDSLSVVDLASGLETRRLVAGDGPWALARSDDGRSVLLTNVRPQFAPFRSPVHSEIGEIDAARGVVERRFRVPDANMLQGIAFVPGTRIGLFTLQRTKHLVPSTRLTQGWSINNGLGVVWPDGSVDQVLLDAPHDGFPDPNAVDVSPDGKVALVTSGGSDRVAVIDVEALLGLLRASSVEDRRDRLPYHLGQSARFVVRRVAVGRNPRAVRFAPDGRRAYVANALDDSISVLAAPDFTSVAEIALGGPAGTSETRRGERLFHSARNAYGRQFSCSSCHPDGHTNGLTFDIEPDGPGMSPVDNRTLRGIFDTAPFKWEGTNPSLRRQCGARLAVFFTRLAPFEDADLDALVRYMATIEVPPNPYRRPDGLTPSQRRGKAVFERTTTSRGYVLPREQRCNTCHNTPYATARVMADVKSAMWFDAPADWTMEQLEEVDSFGPYGILFFLTEPLEKVLFDTPQLHGVHDSPPYLHNGAARTLEELWTRFNLYEGHGFSGDMTRRELNDLIAYLKSL